MQIKEMRIRDVITSRAKKIILELTSVKFWGIVFLGYMNAHIILADKKFDMFGMAAFLAALGIREAAEIFQQKAKPGGGDPK